MPELPDLNVFARNLDKTLAEKKIEKIGVENKSSELKKEIEGSKLKRVYREGKELHFEFSNGNILAIHLMLHGGLTLLKGKNDKKNTIVEMQFDNDDILVLTDYQGAANITLNPVVKDSPDALSDKVDYQFLKENLSKKEPISKPFCWIRISSGELAMLKPTKFCGNHEFIPNLFAIRSLMKRLKHYQRTLNLF